MNQTQFTGQVRPDGTKTGPTFYIIKHSISSISLEGLKFWRGLFNVMGIICPLIGIGYY